MDSSSPTPRVPPPWRLRGSGWIFLFTFKPWFLRTGGFLPPELEGTDGFEGQLGAVMLVDYRQSPVGPYRELLFLAGRNLRWRHHRFSITRIYVSTEASAVNGRENWAIPKQTASAGSSPSGTSTTAPASTTERSASAPCGRTGLRK